VGEDAVVHLARHSDIGVVPVKDVTTKLQVDCRPRFDAVSTKGLVPDQLKPVNLRVQNRPKDPVILRSLFERPFAVNQPMRRDAQRMLTVCI
jgi:hypothetical protein